MAIVDIPKPEKKIPIGISACLMGHKVRYNGGHKRSSLCMNTLADYFDLTPVCPEVGIGLGTPREPIRLVGSEHDYAVVGTDTKELDVTEQLRDYGINTAREMTSISGYILMQKSPSCGMARVKIYHPNGNPSGFSGSGLFAKGLMETNPLLPVEEEGRLHDPVLKENFFTRIYAFHRWQTTVQDAVSYEAIGAFHAAYKYTLMAHNPQNYTELGRLVAKGRKVALAELQDAYITIFMKTLARRATRKSHTNVMLHLLGYIKQTVASKDRQQILKLIEEYRQGIVPLVVPLTLLRHFLDIHGSDYVKNQAYLKPYPEQLGLRNLI